MIAAKARCRLITVLAAALGKQVLSIIGILCHFAREHIVWDLYLTNWVARAHPPRQMARACVRTKSKMGVVHLPWVSALREMAVKFGFG